MYRKLSVHLTQFSGEFFSLCLFQLGNASHRLRTQDVASPVATDLVISVIIIGPNSFHQLSQSTLVFRVNLCEGNSGACLPVDQAPQPGLSLDDAVGHLHLLTQGLLRHLGLAHLLARLAGESSGDPPLSCHNPLLSTLGLPHDEFTFSKDIMNPASPHFGYFTRPNFFGMVTPENQLVYNLEANTVQLDEGTEKGANLEKGKAFLQKLYDDLAKR